MSGLNDKAQIAYGECPVIALDQSIDDYRGHFMIDNPSRWTGTAYCRRGCPPDCRLRQWWRWALSWCGTNG
jgi:hypothetical protein